jgi:hypothetical protein
MRIASAYKKIKLLFLTFLKKTIANEKENQ